MRVGHDVSLYHDLSLHGVFFLLELLHVFFILGKEGGRKGKYSARLGDVSDVNRPARGDPRLGTFSLLLTTDIIGPIEISELEKYSTGFAGRRARGLWEKKPGGGCDYSPLFDQDLDVLHVVLEPDLIADFIQNNERIVES